MVTCDSKSDLPLLWINISCLLFFQPLIKELGAIHPVDKSVHLLDNLNKSIESFIDFLSEGLVTQHNAFEGVVLLCQSEDSITNLIKHVRQAGQESRFTMVVKGMGDLKSFVRRDYEKYLRYVEDLDLPFKNWSDTRAKDMSDLLNRLLGEKKNI